MKTLMTLCVLAFTCLYGEGDEIARGGHGGGHHGGHHGGGHHRGGHHGGHHRFGHRGHFGHHAHGGWNNWGGWGGGYNSLYGVPSYYYNTTPSSYYNDAYYYTTPSVYNRDAYYTDPNYNNDGQVLIIVQ